MVAESGIDVELDPSLGSQLEPDPPPDPFSVNRSGYGDNRPNPTCTEEGCMLAKELILIWPSQD